jgi:hypothetical protein
MVMAAVLAGWAVMVAAPARADTSIAVVDSAGAVGAHSTMVLDAAGNPVVAYHDATNRVLKLAHCNDPDCVGGDESIAVVDTSEAGFYNSLVLDAAGNPVISYWSFDDAALTVAHCNDPGCAGGDESIVVLDSGTGGVVGKYSSLALDAAGNPVVSYIDETQGDLKLLHCNDPDCAGGDDGIVAVDTVPRANLHTSLALDAAGNPVVAYTDASPVHLKLVHCNDPACAGGDESIVVMDDPVDRQAFASSDRALALDAAGNPVVAYTSGDTGTFGSDLTVAHCNDPLCAGGDESVVVVTQDAVDPSLVLDAAGNPVISIARRDALADDLYVVRCDDPDCAGGEHSIVAVDTAGDVGRKLSVALDAVGHPVVAYHDDAIFDLKLAHCDTATCAPDTPPPPALSLDPATALLDGEPMTAAGTNLVPGDAYELAVCRGALCAPPQAAVAAADGTIAATVPAVQRFTSVTGRYVSCRADCEVVVRDLRGVIAARQGFAMAEGTVSVTPDAGLTDGQVVQVTGADLMPTYAGPTLLVFPTGDWALTQCDRAVVDDLTLYGAFAHCAMPTQAITVDGSTLDVTQGARAEITHILGGATDCRAEPGACVLGLLRLEQDASISAHLVPLTFGG